MPRPRPATLLILTAALLGAAACATSPFYAELLPKWRARIRHNTSTISSIQRGGTYTLLADYESTEFVSGFESDPEVQALIEPAPAGVRLRDVAVMVDTKTGFPFRSRIFRRLSTKSPSAPAYSGAAAVDPRNYRNYIFTFWLPLQTCANILTGAVAGALLAFCTLRLVTTIRRRFRARPGFCPACRYQMLDLPRCPECGYQRVK